MHNLGPLQSYVNEQIPKLKTIDSRDLSGMFEHFRPEEIVKQSGMSANEIIDSFRLSLITESLTEQYAKTFKQGASLHGAQWLNDYVVGFWEPDENGHADHFKNVLVDFGINQTQLDFEIGEARETTDYQTKHNSGLHPIALTTYGLIQECITDYWYELQRAFFPSSSNTAKIIGKVKGREALHTVQFRSLTALQLEADPFLLKEVIHAIKSFEMPSNHIPNVSAIEAKTQTWIPKMNGSVLKLLERIITHLHIALQDKEKLGKVLTEYASSKEQRFFSLVPNHIVAICLDKIKGGHGIIGEVILEDLGIVSSENEAPKTFSEEVQFRIKEVIKKWVSSSLQLEGFVKNGNTAF